jgi:hypothetical protein
MMGLFIPVLALSIIGMDYLRNEKLFKGKNRLLIAVIMLFAFPTNLLIIFAGISGTRTYNPMIFLSRDEANALHWIELNTLQDSLILASPEMSLFIPSWTGRRVLYGHPYETVQAEDEKDAQIEFFSSNSEMVQPLVINGYKVDYIFYGQRERKYGSLPEIFELVVEYGLLMILKTQILSGKELVFLKTYQYLALLMMLMIQIF